MRWNIMLACTQSLQVPRSHFSSTSSSSPSRIEAVITQYFSGLKYLIYRKRYTTKPRVGIWQGPQLMTECSLRANFLWKVVVWQRVKVHPILKSISILKLTASASSQLGCTRLLQALRMSVRVTAAKRARWIRSLGLIAVMTLITSKAMASPSLSQSSQSTKSRFPLASLSRFLFRSCMSLLTLMIISTSLVRILRLSQVCQLLHSGGSSVSKRWPRTELKVCSSSLRRKWNTGLNLLRVSPVRRLPLLRMLATYLAMLFFYAMCRKDMGLMLVQFQQ